MARQSLTDVVLKREKNRNSEIYAMARQLAN